LFKRILVANRGEIALRVIRACRELGIAAIAVYSDADRQALHTLEADEAIYLGPTPPAQSYLNSELVINAAARTRCDAIHPGYGFLAESAAFAREASRNGLTFIGPSAAAIEQMGDKLSARTAAARAGMPVVPGTSKAVSSAAEVRKAAAEFGYPIAIKASAGGGGKGLKVADTEAEVESAMSLAIREAVAYFADGTVYVERYLTNPKHVEVQVLADRHGAVVHLGERDCSMQRRHQKLVEETPPCIGHKLQGRMHDAALALIRSIGYDSAGTIECLVQADDFYFLEMNTRIQVEHTISEATFGFDLVKAQIRIAAGERLWFTQDNLQPRGHALQCRINAEFPPAGFAPSPGRITRYIEPGGPGIRIDGAAFAGWNIGSDYDSLVAKVIAWGADREEARQRMLRALAEFSIEGIQTTIPFHRLLLETPAFVDGSYSTGTVDAFVQNSAADVRAAYGADISSGRPMSAAVEAGTASDLTVEVNDKQFRVRVFGLTNQSATSPAPAKKYRGSHDIGNTGATIAAPMHGIIAEIRVTPGDRIESGQVVAVIEAMKMMNEVITHRAGTVRAVSVKPGQTIETGSSLISLDEDRASTGPS
jgi:acetyl-CoA/propionyl-CoA carboxylase, biotin carboxylase, biotin carboxyl carrier protein